ncbi:MAG: hypothetical protein HW416_1950 [Chloroflexi bacterium]|nr:hypothetical protein [Chloroflexota bacterium]
MAVPSEPGALVLPISGAGSSIGGTDDISFAVNHRLVGYDDRGTPFPMLAAEIPTRDRGSWVVRPDGTMRTTFTLRGSVTWHDGTALTASDFVFSHAVISDQDFAFGRDVIDLVSKAEALDARTVAYEWRAPYPFAAELAERDFAPLPAHLLSDAYRGDKERFQQLPFFREGFVGTGPYQIEDWRAGVDLTLRAYDRFYAGRPRIDRVIVRFMSDPNTVMASLLAGAIDGEIPRAFDLEQGMLVRRQWEAAGKRPTVILQPESWRHMFVQWNEPLREPTNPELNDVRVRRALFHAIDRPGLAAALLEGETPVADTVLAPDDPRWAWVDDVVTRYAHDPRRAQELLAEIGWQRGVDGGLVRESGERVVLPLWTVAGQDTEKVIAIIAEDWKSMGARVDQYVIPRARSRDLEFRASFPGFYYAGISPEYFNTLRRMESKECPRLQTRWVGTNIGCYQNPSLDRLVADVRSALDTSDQRRLWREIVRFQTEQLPILPMFFNLSITLFREGVSGVKGNAQPPIGATWNIAEWDIR